MSKADLKLQSATFLNRTTNTFGTLRERHRMQGLAILIRKQQDMF